MTPLPYNLDKWKEFSGEMDAQVVMEPPRFAEPLGLAGLADVRPAQCTMTDVSEEYGASLKTLVERLLVTPQP